MSDQDRDEESHEELRLEDFFSDDEEDHPDDEVTLEEIVDSKYHFLARCVLVRRFAPSAPDLLPDPARLLRSQPLPSRRQHRRVHPPLRRPGAPDLTSSSTRVLCAPTRSTASQR